MYLSRLYINNFRSIKELDLRFSMGKNVIVGRNNSGKSNIIKALDIVLGESSPTYAKSDNISDNDFYTWKEIQDGEEIIKAADVIRIWCELERDDDEQLNYDELYKCFGFYVHAKITYWDKISGRSIPIKSPIRIPRQETPTNLDAAFLISEDDSQEKDYINPKLKNQKTFEKQFEDKYCFALAFVAKKNDDGSITKEVRLFYCENELEDWIMAFRASVRNELLQSAIIPSFRDPQNQLRLTNWTWYGKLIRYLTDQHDQLPELQAALQQVREVADKIFETVSETVTHSALDVAFPGTSIQFRFNAENKTDLYKTCLIYIDDGFKSLITEKGSGIQSATIIGLFNYYTQNVNKITSALLCIEEPEIYLHPHARRVISDRLDDFLDNNRNQVIITTHSVEFIRTTQEDLNIILVQRDELRGTTAKTINIRRHKNLLIDNNQNELFFADKAIVCEGFDAHLITAIASELFPKKLDEQNISVVSVGGKDRISLMVKLILELGIKCFIVADFDYLLRDKKDDRKKYGDIPAHESILNLGEEFFTQECIRGDGGKKLYGNLVKLRNRIKKADEKAFYTAKRYDEVNIERVNLLDILEKLRKSGICILSGEIEDLSKGNSIMSREKKLSLEGVYELNSRLAGGNSITDLLETEELHEFLSTVLDR